MTASKSLLLLLLAVSLHSSNAYVLSGLQDLMTRAFRAKPELQTFSDAFPGHVLDVRLDIGDENEPHKRMCIRNLVLSLEDPKDHHDDDANSNNSKQPKIAPMPGTHPDTSGGVGKLQVVKNGHFIDLTGTVTAKFADTANWELVWRQDAPSGTLLCGLDLQEDAKRNSAVLPKGRIYLR